VHRLAPGLAEERWDEEFESGLEHMLDRIAGSWPALRRLRMTAPCAGSGPTARPLMDGVSFDRKLML
jgi:hypothetical protein